MQRDGWSVTDTAWRAAPRGAGQYRCIRCRCGGRV